LIILISYYIFIRIITDFVEVKQTVHQGLENKYTNYFLTI